MPGKYSFGVDIGGTAVKIGVFDTSGNLFYKESMATDISENGESIIPGIAMRIDEILKSKNIPVSLVKGIGLCVPGPVLECGMVDFCPNIGWRAFDAGKVLSEMVGIPVKAGNDAALAAVGEKWKGNARGFSDFVMVTLGTGVGGGIFLGGRLFTGMFGAAGEIGHMTVNPFETESCRCGKKGCLEQYCSATGIVRLAKKNIREGMKSSLKTDNLDSKEIFRAAEENDESALNAVETASKYLGAALSSIDAVLDTEAFIIGGGVSNAGDFLIKNIEPFFSDTLFSCKREKKILLSELKEYGGMFGAASLFWE